MKTLEELKEFYNNVLIRDLRSLEAKRNQEVNNARIVTLVVIVFSLIIGAAAASRGISLFFWVSLLGGIYLGEFVYKAMVKGYVINYKQQIVGTVISFLDPNFSYNPSMYLSIDDFRNSHFFLRDIDRYSGDDLVKGIVGKTDFIFSEVHAEYKTTITSLTGRRVTTWHTIFSGLFFVGDFNKNFQGRTYVLPDTAERLLGSFGNWLQSVNFTRDQLVRLEDPEFEKSFVVYGDDQVEARYILSTSLMERIVQFKRKTNTQVFIAFIGSKVVVAVPMSHEMFEPEMYTSLVDFKLIQEYYEDLCLAIGIIDDLNLNTRIWSKE